MPRCSPGAPVRALVIVALLATACRQPVPFPGDVVRHEVRRCAVEASAETATAGVATDRLFSGALLDRFYSARRYEPAWSRDGELLPEVDGLLGALRDAPEEGLNPADYHYERLLSLVKAARREHPAEENLRARARLLGSLDALLTDAFFLYGAHLARGKVDVERIEPRWAIAGQHPELPGVLAGALETHGIDAGLRGLLPHHAYYRNLRTARDRYRAEMAEGGRKGKQAAERVRRLELNMERWRWLPRNLGTSHVLVDVAAFELAVMDEGRQLMRMKVVAGSEAWQTPDFTSEITQIVLNPYWNAPRHVLASELINYMRADPNYLTNNKMTLLRKVGEAEEVVDPATVDFARVTERNLDFRLRQDPGPLNVLGRVMFRLPNKYDIYLHDTPYQEDFGKTARMYSHGCVRVQSPTDLAMFLLRGERGWTRQRVAAEIDSLQEHVITLHRPVDTHVIYATAWAHADGRVRWVSDVYQRDAKLDEALHARVPRRAGANRRRDQGSGIGNQG